MFRGIFVSFQGCRMELFAPNVYPDLGKEFTITIIYIYICVYIYANILPQGPPQHKSPQPAASVPIITIATMKNLWHTMEELANTMTNQGFPEVSRDVFERCMTDSVVNYIYK